MSDAKPALSVFGIGSEGILLTDGTLRVHNGRDIIDTKLTAGQAYNRVAGTQHDVMNASDHPLAFVEIEIKRPEALLAGVAPSS